jgi:hypothetical protein
LVIDFSDSKCNLSSVHDLCRRGRKRRICEKGKEKSKEKGKVNFGERSRLKKRLKKGQKKVQVRVVFGEDD